MLPDRCGKNERSFLVLSVRFEDTIQHPWSWQESGIVVGQTLLFFGSSNENIHITIWGSLWINAFSACCLFATMIFSMVTSWRDDFVLSTSLQLHINFYILWRYNIDYLTSILHPTQVPEPILLQLLASLLQMLQTANNHMHLMTPSWSTSPEMSCTLAATWNRATHAIRLCKLRAGRLLQLPVLPSGPTPFLKHHRKNKWGKMRHSRKNGIFQMKLWQAFLHMQAESSMILPFQLLWVHAF